MLTSDYDYHLPQHLIAQSPAQPRDSSRLLVLHRDSGSMDSIALSAAFPTICGRETFW